MLEASKFASIAPSRAHGLAMVPGRLVPGRLEMLSFVALLNPSSWRK